MATRKTAPARKPAPPRKKARVAKPPAVAPRVVEESKVTVTGPELRKKELIAEVVLRSGVKKRDAKPVVEAMLEILGETAAEGRDCRLPPLGRLKVTRVKKGPKARVVTMRLRRNEEVQEDNPDPLAQAAE